MCQGILHGAFCVKNLLFRSYIYRKETGSSLMTAVMSLRTENRYETIATTKNNPSSPFKSLNIIRNPVAPA